MKEVIMQKHAGREALERVFAAVRGDGAAPGEITDEVWTDFSTAVAVALSEGRAREAEGLARWRDSRAGK